MQPNTNKSKNNNVFENRRQPQFVGEKEDDPKKIMQLKTI